MAHKVKIGGTNYEVTGGRPLVSGTAHRIVKGRTLKDGTGYDMWYGQRVLIGVGTLSYENTLPNGNKLIVEAWVSWGGTGLTTGMNAVRSSLPLKISFWGELYDANGNIAGLVQNLKIYHNGTLLARGDDTVTYEFSDYSAYHRIELDGANKTLTIYDGLV